MKKHSGKMIVESEGHVFIGYHSMSRNPMDDIRDGRTEYVLPPVGLCQIDEL